MQNQKGFVKILAVIIVVFVLLVTAPWMNKQIIHDNVLQQHGKIDGSVDKNDKIICDYEVMWLPFGRFVASCEGGHFVPFFKFKKINNRNQESSFAKKEKAAWKTYRNEEYGFEFKYPFIKYWMEPEVKIENFSSAPKTVKDICDRMILEGGIQEGEYCLNAIGGPRAEVSQEELIKWKNWIGKGIINQKERISKYGAIDAYQLSLKEEFFNIGEEKAMKLYYRSSQSPTGGIELRIFSKNDLIVLNMPYLFDYSKVGNAYNENFLKQELLTMQESVENKAFDQILSTFRFIK